MKRFNQKGFTLAELLIVVAIIAVLVAISIPIFSQQLERSREQTDIANLRAAKAAAVAAYLSDDTYTGGYYDAALGKLVAASPSTKYGKGTAVDGGCGNAFVLEEKDGEDDYYKGDTNAAGKVIQVTVTVASGAMKFEWVA